MYHHKGVSIGGYIYYFTFSAYLKSTEFQMVLSSIPED